MPARSHFHHPIAGVVEALVMEPAGGLHQTPSLRRWAVLPPLRGGRTAGHVGNDQKTATAKSPEIKDAWRLDKSHWWLKTGVCSAMLLCTSALYVRRLAPASGAASSCTDTIMLGFGVVYTSRLLLSMLVLMPRPPDWHEIPIVYMIFLPSIFAALAIGRTPTAACGPSHSAGMLLYAVGSALSTVGEFQRWRFKSRPTNKGRLMTTGLWAWSMHVNYLGDSLLFIGWTLAAGGAWWTWFVPTVVTTLFLTMHIPNLDEYLLHRYPHEFPAYAAKTSKFMPCIY